MTFWTPFYSPVKQALCLCLWDHLTVYYKTCVLGFISKTACMPIGHAVSNTVHDPVFYTVLTDPEDSF